ncbi:histidine kinase [Pseudonocardia kujensis]|uniref:ATP-dependent DNA ligase n=1 Tax=Pseudonocardia kujensis TaxID=1128675 RepID=UPI001E4174E3|nr:histidine kinase [Pseudonocardia kujensis]MCE0762300.1 histidine kinase [Pseudonocardia kujensis]
MTGRGAGSGMPDVVPPMLPSQGDLADGERGGDWAVEFAWAGFRCVAYVRPGRVRLLSSTARSVTRSFPELSVLGERVRGSGMVLDGVVVALDDAGRPSRRPLMRRTSTVAPSESLRARVPVGFVATDLLWLDGRALLRRPYAERRRLLEGLDIAGPHVLVPPSHPAAEARFVMEAAERFGLDGLHLKRVDAAYKAGRRTRDWLRVPLRRARPVVVGGWMPAERNRPGRVGALLLGIPETPPAPGEPLGPLRYVGRVGIGSGPARRDLGELLRTLNAQISPFAAAGPGAVPEAVAADARWLVPRLVGQAEYQGWTRGAHLRLPVWRGILRPGEVGQQEWAGTPWDHDRTTQADDGAGVWGPGRRTGQVRPPQEHGRRPHAAPAPAAPAASPASAGPEPPALPAVPRETTGLAPAAPASSINRSLEQHFVYNAFNTIAALMRTDPGQARELLLGFADLSRTADRVGTPEIPLADELAAVRAYLAIEQARFGRRLEATVTVEDGLRPDDVAVAPLQVLVLVRETVQQHIEPRPEGGAVTVHAAPDGAGGAEVVVTDRGHGETRLRVPAPAACPG